MLKSTVPTCWTKFVPAASAGGFAFASIRNTSLSGSANGTSALQLRLISSTQLVPLNLTMSPVFGRPGVEPGGFGGRPPLLVTAGSVMVVVWFPEWNAAAYTVAPFGLTASARGVSAKSFTTDSGTPPGVFPGFVASNTQTSARPTPAVVSWG